MVDAMIKEEAIALAWAMMTEGCITIRKGKIKPTTKYPNYTAVLTFNSTDKPLTEAVHKLAHGLGHIYHVGYTKTKFNDIWRRSCHRASEITWILSNIRPFLVIKGEQADLALKLLEVKSHAIQHPNQFTTERPDIQEANWLYTEIKTLNQRHKSFGREVVSNI